MAGRQLFFNLLWRIVLLIATSLGVAFMVIRLLDREFVFTLLIGLSIIIIQIYMVVRYILQIYKTLISFIDTVGLKSATELQFHEGNTIFPGLEQRLNQLKSEVSSSRFEVQKNKSLLDIVVDEMDTGLICINQSQEVVFSNKTANSILNATHISHFREISKTFPVLSSELKNLKSGSSKIITLSNFKASVRCKHFNLDKQRYSLFSIRNIQREVDAQEIVSWQKLIRVLTHEIMNSIGPILSLSKSLRNSVEQPEKLISGLIAIENTGEGLINFITEYRKLSSLPLPEKTIFSVNETFNLLKNLFSEECIENKIEFHVHPIKEELKLEADQHQVEQILINLIKNAIESLENSSTGIIELDAFKESEGINIMVVDNGPGIPDELNEQIFVPFFTTKNKGSGIGLSLSRQIMANHNGSIEFSSNKDGGTKFTLKF